MARDEDGTLSLRHLQRPMILFIITEEVRSIGNRVVISAGALSNP